MATVKFKHVSLRWCNIHPEAKTAYAFTTALAFQLKAEWSKVLTLSEVSPPWVIFAPDNKSYSVFNHWKPLLPRRRNQDRLLKVMVWQSAETDIEELAWRYVADLLDSSIHRESVLYRLAHFIDIAPEHTQSKFRQITKSNSLETLCRFYSDESRSPVRMNVEDYRNQRDGDGE
ncbi:MAG: hypothetical protein QMC38_10240 [Sinobacterium sp.]